MRRPLLLLCAVTAAVLAVPASATSPEDPGGVVQRWRSDAASPVGGLRAPSTGWERARRTSSLRTAPRLRTATSTAPACATAAPTSATGWQAAFDALNDDRWSGADQGSSLRLPDGRLLWVFDDTFQGAQAADGSRALGSRFVHNSLVLADRGCLRGVTGPTGAEVVPGTPDGQWFWPLHAVVDGGRLFLPSSRVQRVVAPDGTSTFATSGTWLAELTVPAGGTPVFTGLWPTPASATPDTTPQWGSAVAQAGGYTYVYGTQRVAEPFVFGKALYVARVPAGSLTDLPAWRFWTGTGWSATASSAQAVKGAVGGVSTSLSVWRAGDGTWRALTKKDDYLGKDVVLLRAPAATGPWSETVVGTSPSGAHPGETTYNAFAHPEIALKGGDLLWSISRNDADWADQLANADLYKPQFAQTSVR
ncbi:MAG: hypothetical protein JWN17_2346 [Frankiales bacterium]|nr:hypothetical protein [Frankiales bacterium]